MSWPGSVLARATSARALVEGEAAFTTSTKGAVAMITIGWKSRSGWYGFFGYRLGATLKMLLEPISSV